MLNGLAWLTADEPGTGGVIKQRPEDFFVEELPLYEPTGAGEHLYLFIQKRLVPTLDLVRDVARAFRVGRRDVGYAGMKDKHAVTRQHLSIWLPKTTDDEVSASLARLAEAGVQVLWAQRHANKLRRGHLKGNRFVIYIRDIDPSLVLRAKRILDKLAVAGVPNYVGDQRFGYRGDNDELGRLLLLDEWQAFLDRMLGSPREDEQEATRAARAAYEAGDVEGALAVLPRALRPERQALDALRRGQPADRAVRAIDRDHLTFCINAFQSTVFNEVLDHRLRAGLFASAVAGDVAWKHDSRACFTVDEEAAAELNTEGGRMFSREVSPSGPMWGAGMVRTSGEPATWEASPLERRGITDADFETTPVGRVEGVRRSMRVFLENHQVAGGVDEFGPYVKLAFDLERGAFATVVLREVIKQGLPADEVEP